jgi:predicted nuclease of predicted toxin-antitoxin system
VKFYLDEDISPTAAEILRKKGMDPVNAHETGMLEASDDEQLAFATAKGRAMVTRNRDDPNLSGSEFLNCIWRTAGGCV